MIDFYIKYRYKFNLKGNAVYLKKIIADENYALSKYIPIMNNEYFDTFTPDFSMGVNYYNIRNPCRQLPKIYHEFPKQSLQYKLNVVLNETDSNLISKPKIKIKIKI